MEKKFCTNCGSQLNEGAKFCPNCGNSVVSTNTSETTTNQAEKKKFCTNCGSQLREGVKFCSNCGSVVGSSNFSGTTVNRPETNFASNQGNSDKFSQVQNYYARTKEQYGNLTDQELGFIGSFKYGLVHWNDFQTEESRKSVYWWMQLGTAILLTVGGILSIFLEEFFYTIPGLGELAIIIMWILALAVVIILAISIWAAIARRMKYLNVQNISIWIMLSIVIFPVSFYTAFYLMLIDKPINNQN